MDREALGYRPYLDGLRGVAILAVLGMHTHHVTGWSLLAGGSLGVDIFFVLSGFLITSLLLEEHARDGAVRLKSFYVRRALRLLPAFVLLLAALALGGAAMLSAAEAARTLRAIPIAFFYLSDLAIAFGAADLGALKHTWSLAVEEQFYLVWPPLLCLALRAGFSRRAIFAATAGLAAAVFLLRAILWDGPASISRLYFSIDTRADALLIGCLAAMLVAWRLIPRTPALEIALLRWGRASAAILAALIVVVPHSEPGLYRGGFTLVALATAILILGMMLRLRGVGAAVLERRWLVATGRISYGLYLWHYPVFKAAGNLAAPPPIQLAVALAATFAVSGLSFLLVERRFLRLKRRFDGAAKPAAGVRLAVQEP